MTSREILTRLASNLSGFGHSFKADLVLAMVNHSHAKNVYDLIQMRDSQGSLVESMKQSGSKLAHIRLEAGVHTCLVMAIEELHGLANQPLPKLSP